MYDYLSFNICDTVFSMFTGAVLGFVCVCLCLCVCGGGGVGGLHSCESMDDEWCILTLFETIFGTAAIKIYCVSFVSFLIILITTTLIIAF